MNLDFIILVEIPRQFGKAFEGKMSGIGPFNQQYQYKGKTEALVVYVF